MALVIVLLMDPLAAHRPGFWYSFGTVALLILFFSSRRWFLPDQYTPVVRWLLHGIRTQWVITVGMLPVFLFLFGPIALVSPILNGMLVPWLGLMVLPGLILALLAQLVSDFVNPVGSMGVVHFLWSFAGKALEYLVNAVEWSALVSPRLVHPEPALWVVVAAISGMLCILWPRCLRLKFSGLILLMPLVFYRAEPSIPVGEFRLSMLDVGQGLAVVIETSSSVWVYDAGDRFSDRFNIGRDVVAPYLERRGWSRVDGVIISHKDKDHSGGFAGLVGRLPARQIWSSDPAYMKYLMERTPSGQQHSFFWQSSSALLIDQCHQHQWQVDGVTFQFLGRDRFSEASTQTPGVHSLSFKPSTNNDSCVLLVSRPDFAALLSGDIEKEREEELVRQYGRALQADVLQVPHHGSRTSSSPDFLLAVRPRLALVSAGHQNRFHHPSEKVLKRYEGNGIEVVRTDEAGAILIESQIQPGTGEVRRTTWRGQMRGFWLE
jgi:competence protein ComEC